jgi:general secretion pathway protein G
MIRRNRPSGSSNQPVPLAACPPVLASGVKGRRARAGFSLIELMVVIVIIGILGAFLLAAVQNVQVTARNTTVIADIKNLEKAIADFKLKFGTEPPSFIVLCEKATDWTSPPASPAGLAGQIRYSRNIIRELWPSYDFATNGDPSGTPVGPNNPTAANGQIDIDGDGTEGEILYLNGAECLAFFLGGLQQFVDTNGDSTKDSVQPKGFSSNPQSPFLGYTGNRIGPFYEFKPNRYVDTDAVTTPSLNHDIWEYMDPLPGQTAPYLYFSSYGGKGYRMTPVSPSTDPGTAVLGTDESIMIGGAQAFFKVYVQTPGSGVGSPPTPYKENSFQIISPGLDGQYGYGGFATPDGVKLNPTSGYDPSGRAALLQQERDNLTNFKGGPLG